MTFVNKKRNSFNVRNIDFKAVPVKARLGVLKTPSVATIPLTKWNYSSARESFII